MNKGRTKLPKQKLKGKKSIRRKCIRCGTELSISSDSEYCVRCSKTKNDWSSEEVNDWQPK